MKLKSNLLKEKILIYAIIFSAVWHVFWLSAFKVVVVPKQAKPVKFSNVSFLGPILSKGVFKVSVQPHERTGLEKNYLEAVAKMFARSDSGIAKDGYVETGVTDRDVWVREDTFTALALAAKNGQKIEPGRDID